MSAGEEETDLDLGELIKKGEVAWLSAEEMMKASEAAQTGARRSSPASRHVFTRLPCTLSCRQSFALRLPIVEPHIVMMPTQY